MTPAMGAPMSRSAEQLDRLRYSTGFVGRAAPDKQCGGCGRDVHFLRHPESGKAQVADVDEIVIIERGTGRVVTGYRSHWATCISPPKREVHAKAAAPSKPTPPPWRKPASVPLGGEQLALGEDPAAARTAALINSCVQAWYSPGVKAAIVEAVAAPGFEIEVPVAGLDSYADSTTGQRERRAASLAAAADLLRVRARVDSGPNADEPHLFIRVAEVRGQVDRAHRGEGVVAVRMRLNPRLLEAHGFLRGRTR